MKTYQQFILEAKQRAYVTVGIIQVAKVKE